MILVKPKLVLHQQLNCLFLTISRVVGFIIIVIKHLYTATSIMNALSIKVSVFAGKEEGFRVPAELMKR